MKIGVFDSGLGGLTILDGFLKLLPQYDYIYLGDNARAPYGSRSFETVYSYTLQAVKYLFSKDCQLVVIACNTAGAKALRSIQQNDLPSMDSSKRVLGIIRPCAEVINNYTKTGSVGILATRGTVNSQSYLLEIAKLHPHIKVFQQECPLWASLVEADEFAGNGADYFVKKNIDMLMSQSSDIDAVILACTHYPLLLDKIKKYLPEKVNIVLQSPIVAAGLENYLFRHADIKNMLSKNSTVEYFTTDTPQIFNSTAGLFLNRHIQAKTVDISNF